MTHTQSSLPELTRTNFPDLRAGCYHSLQSPVLDARVISAIEPGVYSGGRSASWSLFVERFDDAGASGDANAVAERERVRPLFSDGESLRAVLTIHGESRADLTLVADQRMWTLQALQALAHQISSDPQDLHIEQPPLMQSPMPNSPVPSWGVPGTSPKPGTTVLTMQSARPPREFRAALLKVAGTYGEGPENIWDMSGDPQPNATIGSLMVDVAVGTSIYTPLLGIATAIAVALVHEGPEQWRLAVACDNTAVHPLVAAQWLSSVADELWPRTYSLEAPVGVTPSSARPSVAAAPGSTPAGLYEAFRDVARRDPDRIAVSFESIQLSYAQLDDLSGRMASRLQLDGVRPGDRVGICLDRSASLVAAVLGVCRAGATYVPMDPAYPRERLSYIAGDAGLRHVIVDAPDFDGFGESVRLLYVDELADGASANFSVPGADIAYIIYTSGTTGRPKGVEVPAQSVYALITGLQIELNLEPTDVWSLFHSSAFDFSVWELWGALLTGGELVVVSRWQTRSPEHFVELITSKGVTVLSQTPSAFDAFQRAEAEADMPVGVRLVVFGGEALDTTRLRGWFSRHPASQCRVVNMYGITETTVHATARTVQPQDVHAPNRSVGHPIPGWEVSVRNEARAPLPIGVQGEIWVAGVGVARGYVNRPAMTAERFVSDTDGRRWYRSGDLGRLLPDGALEHLGRIDSQVKLRGFRIELDEIKSALLRDAALAAATAMLLEEPDVEAGNEQIVAFVVLSSERSDRDLRSHVASFLPDYMIPARFIRLSQLPLTNNGKLDRDELLRAFKADRAIPRDSLEVSDTSNEDTVLSTVLRVWRTILGQHVEVDDDFFESGGSSLLAVKLSASLKSAGLSTISLRDLYLHSTPARLADAIGAEASQGAAR